MMWQTIANIASFDPVFAFCRISTNLNLKKMTSTNEKVAQFHQISRKGFPNCRHLIISFNM
jgi:hypothetical protein